jgi:hypothetical protein
MFAITLGKAPDHQAASVPAPVKRGLSCIDVEGEVLFLNGVVGAVLVHFGQCPVDGFHQLRVVLAQADGNPFAQQFLVVHGVAGEGETGVLRRLQNPVRPRRHRSGWRRYGR